VTREAQVLRIERVDDEDGLGVDVVFDPGGTNNATARHYAPAGVDSLPLDGDFMALGESGRADEYCAGYADTRNASKVAQGECRLYARSLAGDVVFEIWLKGDGSLRVGNGVGSIDMAADGKVTINGVTFDVDGNVVAKGEITAKGATPATSVKLTTHLHLSNTGPTQKPTPGT
jgi:hypothetical protein